MMSLETEFLETDADEIVNACSIPRLTGTKGEEKTVEYIEKKFQSIELTFEKEPFPANKFWVEVFLRLGMALAVILTTLMIILSIFAPQWNLLVLLIIGVIGYFGLKKMGGGDLKLFGRTTTTHNLLGKISSRASVPKGKILFIGHHDSKSQPLTTVQRSTFFTFGIASLLFIVLIFFIDALVGIITGQQSPFGIRIIGYIAFVVLIICAVPLSLNGIGNKSPGALDNASSIAALYMLAKYFIKHPLTNYELWFVLTGAEELGMMGARNFVNAHRSEISPSSTYVINFDMIGRKGATVEVMETAGFPKAKAVSPKLNALAATIAKSYGYPFNGFYLPTGAATDRFLFTKEGIDSMDFINKKAAFETHSKNDAPDKFDPHLCQQFVVVAAEMAKKLDQDAN